MRGAPVRTSRVRLIGLVACAAVMGIVRGDGLALAAPRGKDSREARARAACAAGRVDEGVALLAEIAAENGDPNALYNQARCYQENGRSSEALARFKEYRDRVPSLSPAEAAQLDAFIRDLEADVAAKNSAREPPPAPSTTVAPPPPATPPPALEPPPALPLPPPAPAPQAGRGTRIAAVALALTGAAALGVGVYYTLRVQSLTADLENDKPMIDQRMLQDQYAQGHQAENRQWIAYGVASGALVASAVLFLVSHSSSSAESPRVALVPVVGLSGGGASLRVSF